MTPGPLELGIVLLIALLIFGPKRLPGLGKQLGTGMREFKDGITGSGKKGDDEADEAEEPAAIAAAPVPPAAPPAPAPAAPAVAPDVPRAEDPAPRDG
jgi:sec-independent protein translocase protein TatA